MIIYHGGDINNLDSLLDNFTILTPEEKMKWPSTGGGNVGLSATRDKKLAKRYSEVFGNSKVLSIQVDPSARIFPIDTEGQGLDQFIYAGGKLKPELAGYDAIMELDDAAEKEIRILNADKFKPIRLEAMNPLETFIEAISMSDDLHRSVTSGYSAIFETITPPMQHLKHAVTGSNSSVVPHVQQYMKAARKSAKEASDNYEIAREGWYWFADRIKDETGNQEIDTDESIWENEDKYDSILYDFMNEYPHDFDNMIDRYTSDIEPNQTAKSMDYRHPVVNKWMVHFSSNAWDIFFDGFKYGTDDPTKLALTNAGSTKGKYGNYLFAFDMDDADKYGRGGFRKSEFKYGDKAIVFVGSGLEFYHHGDEEPQIVFDKDSPKGCFLVKEEDTKNDDARREKYVIYGHAGKRSYKALASKEKFSDALDWCRDNVRQYLKFYRWN